MKIFSFSIQRNTNYNGFTPLINTIPLDINYNLVLHIKMLSCLFTENQASIAIFLIGIPEYSLD